MHKVDMHKEVGDIGEMGELRRSAEHHPPALPASNAHPSSCVAAPAPKPRCGICSLALLESQPNRPSHGRFAAPAAEKAAAPFGAGRPVPLTRHVGVVEDEGVTQAVVGGPEEGLLALQPRE
jgi:hypothetical protein